MKNVTAIIKNIRDIMRQDKGISGDAQRLEQLGWMLFLKIMDDKDLELEILKDGYQSVIPEKFQWRNWAADSEGISGNELLHFIDSNSEKDKGLFSSLKELSSTTNPERAFIVKEVFDGSNNYMKSGYEMRKVINKLNEIDFNNKDDKHIFGDIYESILKELQAAGNKGEFYTPNAVTKLMTTMTDPKLGEIVLDPAAGTGGFLTMAIDHVREKYVRTVADEKLLQKNIKGWELKPVAYVLGLTNLIIHGIDVPDFIYKDSLKTEYNGIGSKDRVDVILANPPFGASIADGVETNFPQSLRCKESADLFIVLILQLLKRDGRAAVILPDGSMKGDGDRIREKLLNEANLHTILRLPETSFFPATVSTNILFFEKGMPTKKIWYYQHKLPLGQKSYSKRKPLYFEEFKDFIDWWGNREENEHAYQVDVSDIEKFNLDIKHPKVVKKKEIKTALVKEEILNKIKILNKTINDCFIPKKDINKNAFIIGDFLKRIKDSVDLEDGVKYKRVTIRTNHKGISIRDIVDGKKIGTKRQFIIRPNQFLLSKIDARNGAFGIVPAELSDAIITGNFWTYDVDESIINKEWFLYFTQSHRFSKICQNSSAGSTHRKYLKESIFLNHKIEIPSLEEQQIVVNNLNSLKFSQNNIDEIKKQSEFFMEGLLDNYFGE